MTASKNALAVIRPLVMVAETTEELDSAIIYSTNVSDADTPAWSSSTSYTVGQMVSKNYKTFKCTVAHSGVDPTGGAIPTPWQRIGWVNSARAFDNSTTTLSKAANTITYVIKPNAIITDVAIMGMVDATSARVRLSSAASVILYDKTIALTATNKLVTDQLFTGLPADANADLLLDLAGGTSLGVANIVFGKSTQLGTGIHHGANITFQDYSRKEIDEFGEAIFVRRPFAKRATFDTMVERADIDDVMTLLASLRATACLWIGNPNYLSTVIYGFFKDLSFNLASAMRANLSISIEGLTTKGPAGDSTDTSPPPGPTPDTTTWTPTQIFTSGITGAWFEPTIGSLETTATSNTKITQVGDRVGKWLDLSGNNNHVSQATDASRPYFQYAAGNLPCVDYFNQLGFASSTGGHSTAGLGFYGCIGIEINQTTGAIWSNGSLAWGANNFYGMRLLYSSSDGGITLQVGQATSVTSVFKAITHPPGKMVIQWWHDTSLNTLNLKVNDTATVSTALTTYADMPTSWGVGAYSDGATNVFNQKIFCHLHTRNHLPSQANRDQAYTWARKLSGMTESNTDTSTGTFPAKVLGCYYQSYATSTYKITDVPLDFNVIYLFHCKPGQSGGASLAPYSSTHGYTNQGDGSWFFEHYAGVPAAAIQQCRNRGQKVILTLGGSGAAFIYAQDPAVSTAQRTAAWNSIQTIITNLGGVDGLDFNNFEGRDPSTLVNYLNSGNANNFKANMLWIAQQARTAYGANFAITTPASPNETLQQEFAQHLKTNNHLTYAAPQYYDWSGFNAAGYIKGRTDTWVTLMGGDQTKVGLGLSANYPNGPSLSDCIREWDAVKAAYPNIRGMFCWNAQTNLSGGNVWGSTMKARL